MECLVPSDLSNRIHWYPFDDHPQSDTCWSISTGPDDRVYAAACSEGVPGGIVKLVRFDETTDGWSYLLDVDQAVDDPFDSGRLTQCKIHYSFAPSVADGIMYFATHLSAPPFDKPLESAWAYIVDDERRFRGSALGAYDTERDELLWWDTFMPGEGCRAMVLDEERGLVYGLTCPRDRLIVYDLSSRTSRDLGRIGSVNSQVLILDARHRVWTSGDTGELVCYDPASDRIRRTGMMLPYDPDFQNGWHSLLYDAVAAPDRASVFATTYSAQPQLVRLWLDGDGDPRIEALGPTTQTRSSRSAVDPMIDHCGGLVFGRDHKLYYVATRWQDPESGHSTLSGRPVEGVLWRLDPETGVLDELGVLDAPDHAVHYVARGAIGQNGDLFFAYIGGPPAGAFRLDMDGFGDAPLPLRIWG